MLRIHRPSFFIFMMTLICTQNLCVVTRAGDLDREESDHLALLAIKSNIVNGPEGSLSSWNASSHFCQWEGVTCGRRHRRVIYLDLSSRGLGGSLSPFVGNMSFLRVLRLLNNTLEGVIPTEIGRLFRLEQLHLSDNSFQGNVPATLSNFTNLKILSLGYNKLSGTVLKEISSLLNLVELAIHNNNFTGEIPPSIGNLTSLKIISARNNQLNGTIPPSLYNLSLLSVMSISDNQFVGSLPPDIGLKLPKLKVFHIRGNQFTGVLPVSIFNWTELGLLDVGINLFHGKIAMNFGVMPNLLVVYLDSNLLGSGEPDEMNFISTFVNSSNLKGFSFNGNQLRGQLPSSIDNLSTQLSFLDVGYNSIYGSIPPSMMNLVGLTVLALDHNQFTGTIPSNLGSLQQLRQLYLHENSLTGNIPESVGKLSVLNVFSLRNNRLEGTIPSSFGNCQNLVQLDISLNNLTGTIPGELIGLSSLSISRNLTIPFSVNIPVDLPSLSQGSVSLNLAHNNLYGSLPLDIGALQHLTELDLSDNRLAGEVLSSIGGCSSLEYLYLEGNLFRGSIPSSFGSLNAIRYVDLSRNNFSGEIPKFLEKFSFKNLNLSFNNFAGEMPINGVFTDATSISVAGNNRLCGGIPELHLPKCSFSEVKKEMKKGKRVSIAVIIVISIICLLFSLALVWYWSFLWDKMKSKSEPSALVMKQKFLKYSYETLFKGTNGFSSENLIGVGCFSSVYKGVLEEGGAPVAVKVLNLELRGASKSFMAECEAWRSIRHRNLVKIVTVCSSFDIRGNSFKALVYKFMPNGSLERWLHPTPATQNIENELRKLSLLQRINIATDVAHAIDYLHHQGEIPIIHCDLKPSNILLDEDMVAHVADFGLARFLLREVSSITQSSSIGLRGTIGYTPPEYGLGNEMSAEGDVYSFGIFLLEMMTGKRPTESMFENGLNLHNYARKALPNCIIDVVDPILVKEEENGTHNTAYTKQRVECMVSVIKIGIACSVESARDRMDISYALDELKCVTNTISQHEIKVARGEVWW